MPIDRDQNPICRVALQTLGVSLLAGAVLAVTAVMVARPTQMVWFDTTAVLAGLLLVTSVACYAVPRSVPAVACVGTISLAITGVTVRGWMLALSWLGVAPKPWIAGVTAVVCLASASPWIARRVRAAYHGAWVEDDAG